jgi:hypothetical protein
MCVYVVFCAAGGRGANPNTRTCAVLWLWLLFGVVENNITVAAASSFVRRDEYERETNLDTIIYHHTESAMCVFGGCLWGESMSEPTLKGYRKERMGRTHAIPFDPSRASTG